MNLFKQKKIRQTTFCYCPGCNNELISSKSFVKDEIFVTYRCTQCSTISNWDFDAPVPLLIKEEKEMIKKENNEIIEEVRVEDIKKELKEAKKLIDAYESTLNYIDRAITTQHCTMNHMWNTDLEKGKMSGLIQAGNIVRIARQRMNKEEDNN